MTNCFEPMIIPTVGSQNLKEMGTHQMTMLTSSFLTSRGREMKGTVRVSGMFQIYRLQVPLRGKVEQT
jgi:hypothetical protein